MSSDLSRRSLMKGICTTAAMSAALPASRGVACCRCGHRNRVQGSPRSGDAAGGSRYAQALRTTRWP